MLPVAKLYSALAFAETNRLFDQLNNVYAKLPSTTCKRCGTCCSDPPPATIVEFLNVYRYVRDNLPERHQELVRKAAEFFFLDLVKVEMRCPFLNEEDNRCLVYEVRPFSCRAYGQLTEEEFNKRNTTRMLGDISDHYWREFGFTLPTEVLDFKLPYCTDLENPEGKVDGEMVDAGLVYLLEQDARIVPAQIVYEQATLVPLPYHLAMTALADGIRAKRPEVMKEYLEKGEGPLLDKFLERTERFKF
jgi:Fe-S-cluster containining protein